MPPPAGDGAEAQRSRAAHRRDHDAGADAAGREVGREPARRGRPSAATGPSAPWCCSHTNAVARQPPASAAVTSTRVAERRRRCAASPVSPRVVEREQVRLRHALGGVDRRRVGQEDLLRQPCGPSPRASSTGPSCQGSRGAQPDVPRDDAPSRGRSTSRAIVRLRRTVRVLRDRRSRIAAPAWNRACTVFACRLDRRAVVAGERLLLDRRRAPPCARRSSAPSRAASSGRPSAPRAARRARFAPAFPAAMCATCSTCARRRRRTAPSAG